MATTAQSIQSIYIGLLGRAADQNGLDYWVAEIDAGNLSLEELRANIVNEQAEYAQGLGSQTRAQVVAELYTRMFEREAESDDLEYWVNGEGANVNVDQLVLALKDGASAMDQLVLDNKVEAAEYYTANTAEYSADAAKAAVDSVDGTADSLADSKGTTDSGAQSSGETFTLTAGVDTISGTSGNDIINAFPFNADGDAKTTLSSFDTIDGGDGVDTLNITVNDSDSDSLTDDDNNALIGTISNVEIINIDNSAADSAEAVDASVAGAAATEINQIGAAADVSKLAATTTAGFSKTDMESSDDIDIAAADDASSVTVALDTVNGSSSAGTTTAYLDVDGKNLGEVTVSGSIKAGTTGDDVVLNLDVDAGVDTDGEDLTTLTVNSALDTTLAITTGGSTSAVTTLDASGSTGGITFQKGASSTTATYDVTTGSGDDDVTVDAATAKDNAATSTDETKTGSIATGAGNDTVIAKFSGDGTATVVTGEGNDIVTVTGLAAGGTSVNAGAGDDIVDVSGVTLTTKDSLVGGDGTDTLIIAGGTSLVTADYLTMSAAASGFETLEADTETNIDASQVDAQFTSLAFNATTSDNVVTKLGTQALVLKNGSSLTATTAGYELDSDTATAGNQTTYTGAVNATTLVNSTITANAESVDLSVVTTDSVDAAATADSEVAATLTGDVQTATASLTSSRDTDADGDSTGYENLAKLVVDIDPTTGDDLTLQALTSITVDGTGIVTINVSGDGETTNDADVSGKLTSIDLSGMEAFLNLDANGDQTDGSTVGTYENLSTSTVTLNDAEAETLKLGGADDAITTNSTYAKTDTIEGFELVADLVADDTGKTADAAKSDSINVTGSITFEKFETTATTLEAALLEAGNADDGANSPTDVDDLVFVFDGNTYIYQDDSTAGISDDDVLIKLVGEYNLDLLVDVIG